VVDDVLSLSGRDTLAVTRVNSANVQYEGLRIGGVGHRINSKVNQSNKVCIESKRKSKLGSLSICPLPSPPGPIYRWSGLKDREGSDIDYNIDIRHELVFRLVLQLGLA
jgi:hypothetical protein